MQTGGGFMLDAATFQQMAGIGLPAGMEVYALGRFGTLGDVHHDVVLAAAAFFEPGVLGGAWDRGRALVSPAVAGAAFLDCCSAWGRKNLSGVAGLDRIVELASPVVAAASVIAAPVFAGMRALPRPDDAPAHVAHLLLLLRELRFARHVAAVVALGVGPLAAVLAGGGGEPNAKMFGWAAPYPDVPSDVAARRAEAEGLTDDRSAEDLSVLDDAGRAELAGLVTDLARALGKI
jgi:hypothetical protein